MSEGKVSKSGRFLRFLVRLFPFDFRADHGREIEQTFRAQQRDAEQEGRAGLFRLWAEFVAGIFRTAPREHLSILRQDATYAVRRMRQSPGFTAVIVLTLALGIGANSAIFSVVNGVLLRPLPYSDGERLVRLRQLAPRLGVNSDSGFSEKEILDYRGQNQTLDSLVEYHSMVFILIGNEPYRVQTGVVSWEFFDIFGVRPLYGRTFRAEDDVSGTEGVLILSYPFWQRAFGGDPAVVGRVLQMNNRPHAVIGILPPLPQYPDENDVYMPVSHCPFRSSAQTRANRNARMSTVFARLKPGAQVGQVRADAATIAQRLQAAYPENYPANSGYTATADSLKSELTRGARTTFLVLLATAGFVLLIACANVANLALSRIVHREREIAIRAALGANRGRLVRQFLTESALLALAGGALGLLIASFSLDLLARFAARFTPRTGEIAVDANVLLFTLLASVLTGLIFGSLPALAVGGNVVSSLKEGGQASPGRGRHRARSALVVTQVALSLVLLAGAGLMMRSFVKLLQVQPGFNPENVLAARISVNFTKYSDPDVRKVQERFRSLYERIFRELEGQRQIVAIAATSSYPMMPGATPFTRPIQIEGHPVPEGQPAPRAELRTVTPEYFRVIGLPLVRGRIFSERDDMEAPPAVVVSQAMARHFWGEEDPIGKRIGLGNPPVWNEIVGIVGDVKEYGPGKDAPLEIYQPFAQGGFVGRIVVRTTADPLQLSEMLRTAVLKADPDAPADQFRTLEQVHSESVAAPRLTTLLLGIFAGLALVITATGIAGVLALGVSQRTHEIGIRMALGATPGQVLAMVLGQGLRLVFIGLALGMAGAVALTRLMSGLLFGVEPTDPLTFAAVSLVLIAVAVLACLLPARRASTIDPMLALRTE
jgi:predicted permease